MSSNGAVAVLDPWLHTEVLRLREGVEVITGAGGRTMLVSPAGKFLNISSSGVAVVRRLGAGMTGVDLMATLTAEQPGQAASIQTVVPGFLTDLRQSAVLNVEPAPLSTPERFTRLGKIDPVKRFPLIEDPNRYARPVARALAHIPARLLSTFLLAIPFASIPLVVLALSRPAASHRPTLWLALGALVVMVCEIVVHECSHAVAMAYNNVRPKNAGIGLLFYMLPIAYVDRTDTYRHQGRVGRVLISLVGPISDLWWAGVSSIMILSTSGQVAAFFHLLLLLQIFSVLANINPLFPSDGYHALEASLGSINMRGRALTFVLHGLSRTPQPLYLRKIRPRARLGYVAYVVVSLLYTLVVVLGLLVNIGGLALKLIS